MSWADFRRVGCDGPCSAEDLTLVAVDPLRDCHQLVRVPQYRRENLVWMWERDGRVAAVGVVRRPGGGSVVAPSGLALGDPVQRSAATGPVWGQGPVPVVQGRFDGSFVVTADLDANGFLDYTAVVTDAGRECAPDLDGLTAGLDDVPADEPMIVGNSLRGVSMGMTGAQAAAVPGWRDIGVTDGTCRTLFHVPSAVAHVRDGIVVGLAARRASGGFAVGDRALSAFTRFEAGSAIVTGPANDPVHDRIGVWGPQYGRIIGVDREGRRLELDTVALPTVVAQVSWPAPAAASPDDVRIGRITVGEPCLPSLA
jgi:hypothetical protein